MKLFDFGSKPARVLPGILRAAVAASVLSFAAPALAQEQAETPSADAVIATVNGETITEADLAFAAEDLQQELSNVPATERRAFLASVLIDMKVMANAARADNMQDSEVFRRRLQYLEDRALRRAYFAEKIAAGVTPDKVQAAYDEMVADFTPQEEVRARHILVPDEDQAKALLEEIRGGKSFEEAAQENSIDGSAQNGGDLGFFRRGMMVPPFEEAAFALEVGDVSEPVQSQFGWHLIKLEDKRESSPPPFEQIAPQVQQQVLVNAFDETVDNLKSEASIEVNDPDLKAALDAAAAAE